MRSLMQVSPCFYAFTDSGSDLNTKIYLQQRQNVDVSIQHTQLGGALRLDLSVDVR